MSKLLMQMSKLWNEVNWLRGLVKRENDIIREERIRMEAREREEAKVMKREESDARERQIAIREEQVKKEMQRVEIEKQVLESFFLPAESQKQK